MASQLDAPQIIQEVYNPSNKAIKVGPVGSVIDVTWDYMEMAISTTTVTNDTETYSFKTGGSGGTLVKTVVIVYTTGDRTTLLNVTVT